MKIIKAVTALAVVCMAAGCAVVPIAPVSTYYEPVPVYYGHPAYYGPSVGVRVYGHWGGYRHWR